MRGRPFCRLKSSATVLKRDTSGKLMYGKVEVMHINKEGRAGRCTGSEERGNAFVSGRLMVRDPRVSYDADSSLVNDYDNSTAPPGCLAGATAGNRASRRPKAIQKKAHGLFDPPQRNASHHIVPHRTASHRAGAIRGNPKVARGNPESSKTLVGGRETSYPTGGHPKINDLTNRLRLDTLETILSKTKETGYP
ncbi:hypothetical protein G5I_03339 [Acromyrmex echinatior]|uniref:Uncharacterized protein n=1 Tax=Acromyrmex echinatior TaxID=103372 RepID=F4WCR3_ACREC|nr:hypothetical protein G5I_03339 [Acromyrmex echinatior]